MRQAELDAAHRRSVFEEVCAEQLAIIFPVDAESIKGFLLHWRQADEYAARAPDYTGRTMCQMANVAWACWKSACLIG